MKTLTASPRVRSTFAVVSLTALALPVVARADQPPPFLYHPKPGTLTIPHPVSAFVPKDGDLSAANTTLTSVLAPPGGSPVHMAAVESTGQPHAKEPGVAPFFCTGRSECFFTQLPTYNQGNPNFAYVDVPPSVFSAESSPVPGTLATFDPLTHKWVLTMSTSGQLDPFFASWLPYGPLPGDQGHLPNWWFTAICGPTAASMALMGALAARASTTQIVPGSWMDTSFLQATKPAAQGAPPSPLVVDHNTAAPGKAQMTAHEIQRVINTAVLLGTDPTAGGTEDVFAKVQHDFRYFDTAHPHQVVWLDDNAQALTPAHLVDLLRQRFATVIGIHPYIAHLRDINAISTATVSGTRGTRSPTWDLTFSANGGHCLALSGFSGGDTAKPSFTI